MLLASPCIHVAYKEDMAMRTNLDFSPLFRSSIGFDRMLNALEAASRVDTIDNWPRTTSSSPARIAIASPWRWRASRRTN